MRGFFIALQPRLVYINKKAPFGAFLILRI
jgi:hypothetical protein